MPDTELDDIMGFLNPKLRNKPKPYYDGSYHERDEASEATESFVSDENPGQKTLCL